MNNRLTTEKKTTSIGVRLTPKEKEKIVSAANWFGMSITQLIVNAVNDYINLKKFED